MPDAAAGFYRSSRFDWSGMITTATWKGREFLVPFREPHDPVQPEHGGGAAEEFDQERPPGYTEAQIGEGFLKVGVGVLQRRNAEPYFFNRPYDWVARGDWSVEAVPGGLQFRHVIDHAGWGYVYEKTIALRPDANGFSIARRLRNTGTRAFTTVHYSHHFARFAGRPMDAGYELVLPEARGALEPRPVTIKGTSVRLTGPLERPFLLRFEKPAFAPHAPFRVRHDQAPLELEFRLDTPLSDFRLFVGRGVFCPEPFVTLVLAPGEVRSWTTHYTLREPR